MKNFSPVIFNGCIVFASIIRSDRRNEPLLKYQGERKSASPTRILLKNHLYYKSKIVIVSLFD